MNSKRGKHDHLYYIINRTKKHNVDNISRTKAYQNFYIHYPEIKWALVASMVSRNAGWNMTDLLLSPFQKILSKTERKRMFMTYERANWLIFSDAYPQLLIYKISLQLNKPMFHLLPELHVSRFMVREWERFWNNRNKDRLMTALIINEQNVIHQPVIKQSFFKYHIFRQFPYLLQDFFYLNAIIIPTRSEKLYGAFVHDFTNVTKRITLGKHIASIIFNPDIYNKLLDFALHVEHTGSRRDYEQFFDKKLEKSPILRAAYPVITHQDIIRRDWYKIGGLKKKWWSDKSAELYNDVSNSFYIRRNLLYAYYHLKNFFA
ncbi:DUF2515 family protein [Virgibacillus doumboii]|uniref:DUF2515 family protein n=1 Tax=Virgibacillus doumboii TaxID=2697503 RepID=UPI0013DF8C08|nr:DUF2515 family protein [Virgibacillus doumboii]